jgi:hypothetical protein
LRELAARLTIGVLAVACLTLLAVKENPPAPVVIEKPAKVVTKVVEDKSRVLALESELDTARSMIRTLERKPIPRPYVPKPAEMPEQARDPGNEGKRYFPYKPYRAYRPYRPFKAFVHGDEATAGSAKFCQNDPMDTDCLGSADSCGKEPDLDECEGTQPYCEKHPTNPLCSGTEAYCKESPGKDACIGTAFWCKRHVGAKECRGARDDCELMPRQDQCLGTIAFCAAQFDRRLCPP